MRNNGGGGPQGKGGKKGGRKIDQPFYDLPILLNAIFREREAKERPVEGKENPFMEKGRERRRGRNCGRGDKDTGIYGIHIHTSPRAFRAFISNKDEAPRGGGEGGESETPAGTGGIQACKVSIT